MMKVLNYSKRMQILFGVSDCGKVSVIEEIEAAEAWGFRTMWMLLSRGISALRNRRS